MKKANQAELRHEVCENVSRMLELRKILTSDNVPTELRRLYQSTFANLEARNIAISQRLASEQPEPEPVGV